MPEETVDRRPTQLLALAMAGCAVLLIWEMREHSLLFDEWSFFADYRGHGPEVLLNPFGENLQLLPILLYKAVFELAGAEPVFLRLLLVALNLTCAGLVYLLVARRVGGWIALAAAVMLMLLGAAGDVVATTLGLAILLSAACGLGALVALEAAARGSRRADAVAAVLLGASLASNSLGLAFAAGAAVDVLLVRREDWRRRVWVIAVPLALYAIWRIWALDLEPVGPFAAHPAEITLSNIGTLPGSIAESASAAAVTITGLFRGPGTQGPGFYTRFGPPLVVAFAVLAAIRLYKGPPLDRRVLVFAAMPLVYWVLIGLVVSDRVPNVSRYQYASAIFLILLFAQLGAGLRISRGATIGVCAAIAVATLPNLINLHDGAKFLRYNAQLNRAELTAIEIARDTVPYDLLVEPYGVFSGPDVGDAVATRREPTTDIVISAGRYLSARDDYGSLAYSEDELLASPSDARRAADLELAAALGLRLAPAPGTFGPTACFARDGEFEAPARGARIEAPAGSPVAVSLRRFSDEPAVELGEIPAGESMAVALPADRSTRPWLVSVSNRPLVCPLSQGSAP